MINITTAQIAAATGGTLRPPPSNLNDKTVSTVTIDSRHATAGSLFVAMKGERVDGHDFAAAAVAAGAVLLLVERELPGLPCVVVDDTVAALGRLASHVLARLHDLTVVGVTGSSGKTTTKDLIGSVLGAHASTVAPVGSYNNEIGLPLTVLRCDPESRYLVLEMGARSPGHIAYLCSIAPPRIGVVLNVGLAHVGEFGSIEATARAKSELVAALPTSGTAVLNADDPYVVGMRDATSAAILTYGGAGDVRAMRVRIDAKGRPSFTLRTPSGEAPVALRLHGEHQVGNALAAAAVGTVAGMGVDAIAAALTGADSASRWRMEVTDRQDGVTVINDAYNANPDSVRAALRALVVIGGGRRTWAVLGEMLELGRQSEEEHESIGRLATRLGIDRLIAVGAGALPIKRGAAQEDPPHPAATSVADTQAAADLLAAQVAPGDVVLVKASRAVGLERVAAALMAGRGTIA